MAGSSIQNITSEVGVRRPTLRDVTSGVVRCRSGYGPFVDAIRAILR